MKKKKKVIERKKQEQTNKLYKMRKLSEGGQNIGHKDARGTRTWQRIGYSTNIQSTYSLEYP